MVLTKKAPTKESATSAIPNNDKKKIKTNKTRVVIHCDVGFNNHIYIRGVGADLSWDKGMLLQNTAPDEWVWETDKPFNACEFKVLINDSQYEQGDNHALICEKGLDYQPRF
jgi:hypothetical protein